MVEECLQYAMDLSGVLLLYSSFGDSKVITELASLAKEQGKNNVAFLCLFMLGKLEECLQLLVDSHPEAALMARSYLPSKVSEIVAIWRKDLNKINVKAAESLVDPDEYSNMFEDWQIALSVETKVAEKRGSYPFAEEYLSYSKSSNVNLVESFKNMQLEEGEGEEEEEEEAPRENGDVDHEVVKENEEEGQEENAENEEGQEEAVEVDANSIDGVVLVSGKEVEEEWDLNNDGTLSA